MVFLLLLPVVLSALLQAAHFMRWVGPIGLVALVPLVLLGVRRKVSVRILQGLLLLGALEWVRTLVTLVEERAALGQPSARLAVILGSVALFTALSALTFFTPPLARRYAKGAA